MGLLTFYWKWTCKFNYWYCWSWKTWEFYGKVCSSFWHESFLLWSLQKNKNLVTLSLSSWTFSCNIFRPYISALKLDAIAPLVLSLASDTNFADPAVYAEIIVKYKVPGTSSIAKGAEGNFDINQILAKVTKDKNFTTNDPVALTFVHFINKNSKKNGGLKILKSSHKWPTFPSENFVFRNSEIPEIKEGSLLIFDSALFHAASNNNFSTRRTLVTIFSSPLFKQQINLSKIVDLKKKHNYLKKIKNIKFILGLTTNPMYSDEEYRSKKLKMKKKI